jgi:hypothetical protein
LSHVVRYSRQVPVVRDWDVRLLDGRVVHEGPGVAFLTYDDEHHRIAIADPAAMLGAAEERVDAAGSGDQTRPIGSLLADDVTLARTAQVTERAALGSNDLVTPVSSSRRSRSASG